MAYYVIQADGTNDFVITNNEEKAIKVYDKMVDDNPEWECLHFSTWKDEDPEGYDENCPIEEFAQDQIYVDKFHSWGAVMCYLDGFNTEESEEEEDD
jgi:hypothetical protein